MLSPMLSKAAFLLLLANSSRAQTTYTIPSSRPCSNTSLVLNKAPLGVSFEFFAFPGWQALESTETCLGNLGFLSGALPPIRIGGTTQDRALYDPNLKQAVNYSVAAPLDAPASLTYGPSYFDLASHYGGNVTFGLNRRLAQLNNTILAAEKAISTIPSLYALELGNEPDLYGASSPIAQQEEGGQWTPVLDADSQVHWQASVANATDRTQLIQAGVRLQPQNGWSVAQLAPVEVSSGSLAYVRSFGEHSYPQSACGGAATHLDTLMSHSSIVSYTKQFGSEAAVAHSVGKPYFLSETNSATCGGGGISSTFGAALWIVDYVLQAMVNGVQALNFHHGTVGNSPYDWWGALLDSSTNTWTNYTFAPYYGAVFVSAALAGGDRVASLDDGTSPYAVYAVYDKQGAPMRLVLYNSDYYDGTNSTRPSHTFTLNGLKGAVAYGSVTAVRLTSNAATDKVEAGQNPSLAGLQFNNVTCRVQGRPALESFKVKGGSAQIEVKASEAVLVELVPGLIEWGGL